MSLSERPKIVPTPETDPMMRPRSPRPHLETSKDHQPRLRPTTKILPVTEPRLFNYYVFADMADQLHEIIEAGGTLDDSDSEADSDYELPPQTYHREGNELPKDRIRWYNEEVQRAAREIEWGDLDTVHENDNLFGLMALPPSESEPELDPDLDSPSRQLKEELSQMSQSEGPRIIREYEEEQEDYLLPNMPTHDEVLLFIANGPAIDSNNPHVDDSSTQRPDAQLDAQPVAQPGTRKRKRVVAVEIPPRRKR
ncbi:hypothetical protein AUEXF2481DRAFT_25170 [Aureobasidium subglaciale EXF-2481]|uniref:Uncharacterized protein n=1 Tax=Aureobasidium subglaciale (strain EXF-2481) TaxID=1043005 RepID=A0A074YT80_AURSE|nr:uncharacterized protein AUEXF2481DRAFT_25170 [Aureobasidium subglaciale EXF-2481]KER00891.1 hypothetical protein AUEXF2481DRAFT_25170 [Aureobasidium subglaciale EXF-2481]